MIEIELKESTFQLNGSTHNLSYKAQTLELLKVPINKVADLQEIRQSIRIMDAIEACEDNTLRLEDADYAWLKDKLLKVQFPVIDRALLQYIEDMTSY